VVAARAACHKPPARRGRGGMRRKEREGGGGQRTRGQNPILRGACSRCRPRCVAGTACLSTTIAAAHVSRVTYHVSRVTSHARAAQLPTERTSAFSACEHCSTWLQNHPNCGLSPPPCPLAACCTVRRRHSHTSISGTNSCARTSSTSKWRSSVAGMHSSNLGRKGGEGGAEAGSGCMGGRGGGIPFAHCIESSEWVPPAQRLCDTRSIQLEVLVRDLHSHSCSKVRVGTSSRLQRILVLAPCTLAKPCNVGCQALALLCSEAAVTTTTTIAPLQLQQVSQRAVGREHHVCRPQVLVLSGCIFAADGCQHASQGRVLAVQVSLGQGRAHDELEDGRCEGASAAGCLLQLQQQRITGLHCCS